MLSHAFSHGLPLTGIRPGWWFVRQTLIFRRACAKTLWKRTKIKQRNRKIEKALSFYHFHSIRLVLPVGTSGFCAIGGHLVVDDQLIKHKSYDVFELWNCGNFTSDCDDTNSSNNIYLVKYLKFPKMAVGLVSRQSSNFRSNFRDLALWPPHYRIWGPHFSAKSLWKSFSTVLMHM